MDGVHAYINPAVERILGYLPEELIGRQSLNLMHEEDRETIAKELPQWKKQKSGWNSLVIRWRHKDGSYRYLESNAMPILDAQGNLRGFRGVDRDITDRKEAEKRNLDYQERLKPLTLIQRNNQAFFILPEGGASGRQYLRLRVFSIAFWPRFFLIA